MTVVSRCGWIRGARLSIVAIVPRAGRRVPRAFVFDCQGGKINVEDRLVRITALSDST